MKLSLFVLAGAGIIALGFISMNAPNEKNKSTVIPERSLQTAIILELFTSEGCSSCPPADKLLPELARLDSNIIPLSFHVDYWNRLGWTDPFSKPEYSERQRQYVNRLNLESAYTPQLVVNGVYELVGSDRSKAVAAINEALKEKSKLKLTIDHVIYTGKKINFTVYAEGEFKKTNLLAAFVQNHATMKIKAGENKGATLSHINIVRSLAGQKAGIKTEIELPVPENITAGNWQLVVFAQQQMDLKITGAAKYEPH